MVADAAPTGRSNQLRFRLARAFVLTVALSVGLSTMALRSGNPERWAETALLQYLPYPVYLLPAVAASLTSLWLGWRWRLLALASLLAVLVVVMGLCVGRADDGYEHVRVMTYNIKAYKAIDKPRGMNELALEIFQHDPDVLVMQDAGYLEAVQYRQPDVYKAIVGQRQVYHFDQYYVVSRFPIKDCKPWIPFGEVANSFVHCVLTVHKQEVDLINVHFVTPRKGLNATRQEGFDGMDIWRGNVQDRMSQAGRLGDQLRQMKRPRIVAGDLNAPESSNVLQTLLSTGMRDAFSSAGTGYGYTYGHTLRPGISFLRIDHVLVSDQIGVTDAYAGGKAASDHRPVIADLLLVRQ
jgi:endonuclease/exonuclease/phosphatase (EEP) superfamily protein YafD